MLKFKCFLLLFLFIPAIAEAEIKINEIAWMGSTVSANDEWLELYNPTNQDIDLTNWALVANDGSPEIELVGTILANNYFLLERTDDGSVPNITADQIYTGSFGNNGEWLKLLNQNGELVDQINAAEGWTFGDNETKQTMELVNNIWQTSPKPEGSPKAVNSTSTDDEQSQENTDDNESNDSQTLPIVENQKIAKQAIVINEIFPNPIGSDVNDEFIELKNISATAVDLTNWELTTTNQTYVLPSLKIWPGIVVVFKRPETKLALNNTQEKISLYARAHQLIDRVEYKSGAIENLSYQRTPELDLAWDQPSPAKDNTAKLKNPPVIILTPPKEANVNEFIWLDASDSFDPNNQPLKFDWNFGDGRMSHGITTKQLYTNPGTYEIILKITNTEFASSTKKFKIKVTDPNPKTEPTSTTPTSTPFLNENHDEEIPFIFISEFLPNPVGSDDQEFIELFSNNQAPVNLEGWQLDDEDGGNKPYTIPAGTIIKPGQYLSFLKTETNIALNNDQDEVRLFSPKNTMVDYVKYDEIKEGVSMVLDEQFSWQETLTPTPNEINVLDEPIKTTSTTSTTPKILGSTNVEVEQDSFKTPQRYTYSILMAGGVVILGVATIFLKKK